jgi:hypothetical protein
VVTLEGNFNEALRAPRVQVAAEFLQYLDELFQRHLSGIIGVSKHFSGRADVIRTFRVEEGIAKIKEDRFGWPHRNPQRNR